jgi:hypothetical protein
MGASVIHRKTVQRGVGRLPVVVVAVGALLLVGCQGDPEGNEPTSPVESTQATARPSSTPGSSTSPSESPESPPPTPASSRGPAANIPVPEKPALADENTKEGLEAFTRYWFELFDYGYATNDWAAFDAVTDPACGTCGNIKNEVRARYEEGGWISGGVTTLQSFSSGFEENLYGSINSYVEIEQTGLTYFNSKGQVESTSDALPPTLNSLITLHEDGMWFVLDFGSPEGT